MVTWTFQNTENASGDPMRVDVPGRDIYITYPNSDGPLSTPTWEAIREGIEDHKLIYQLEKRISKLRKLGLSTSHYDSYLNKLKQYKVILPTDHSATTLPSIDFKLIRKHLISQISRADKEIVSQGVS